MSGSCILETIEQKTEIMTMHGLQTYSNGTLCDSFFLFIDDNHLRVPLEVPVKNIVVIHIVVLT